MRKISEIDLPFFCILEPNPFVLKLFTQDRLNGFPLCLKDQLFIIHPENYLIFQSWLHLIGGSSNFHCAMQSGVLANWVELQQVESLTILATPHSLCHGPGQIKVFSSSFIY